MKSYRNVTPIAEPFARANVCIFGARLCVTIILTYLEWARVVAWIKTQEGICKRALASSVGADQDKSGIRVRFS